MSTDYQELFNEIYAEIQDVLDRAIGPEEEDGAGAGIVADVHLLAYRYDLALKALAAAGAATVADAIRRTQFPHASEGEAA